MNMCDGSMTLCYRNTQVQWVWMIIFVHFHSKFGKQCPVEFFSPPIANNQTSKMFPYIANCSNPKNRTTLIFMCYQDEMAEQCVSIRFIQQQSHCSGHRAYHPSCRGCLGVSGWCLDGVSGCLGCMNTKSLYKMFQKVMKLGYCLFFQCPILHKTPITGGVCIVSGGAAQCLECV